MQSAPLLALLALSAPAAIPAKTIVVTPPARVVVLLLGADGQPIRDSSAVLGVAANASPTPRIEAVSPGAADYGARDLASCAGERRMTCWASKLSRGSARFLMVLSLRPQAADRTLASAVLLDAERLAALRGEVPSAELEDRLFETALVVVRTLAAATEVLLTSASPIEPIFEEVLTAAAERLPAVGTIHVRAESTLALTLDGRAIGATGAGVTAVVGVPAGDRAVGIGERMETVPVAPEKVATVEAVAVVAPPPVSIEPSLARDVGTYGGIGVAAAGAALVVLAIAFPSDSGAVGVCTVAECGPPSRRFSKRAARHRRRASGLRVRCDRGYVVRRIDAQPGVEAPWYSLIGGVLFGIVVYGISSALNPASSVPEPG